MPLPTFPLNTDLLTQTDTLPNPPHPAHLPEPITSPLEPSYVDSTNTTFNNEHSNDTDATSSPPPLATSPSTSKNQPQQAITQPTRHLTRVSQKPNYLQEYHCSFSSWANHPQGNPYPYPLSSVISYDK